MSHERERDKSWNAEDNLRSVWESTRPEGNKGGQHSGGEEAKGESAKGGGRAQSVDSEEHGNDKRPILEKPGGSYITELTQFTEQSIRGTAAATSIKQEVSARGNYDTAKGRSFAVLGAGRKRREDAKGKDNKEESKGGLDGKARDAQVYKGQGNNTDSPSGARCM